MAALAAGVPASAAAPGLALPRLAVEVPRQQAHGRLGQPHLPGYGPPGGVGRLRHRRPGDQQLPPFPLAPDVQHHHLAGPDPDPQGQGQPLGRRVPP